MTGKPEVIGSSVGLVSVNALLGNSPQRIPDFERMVGHRRFQQRVQSGVMTGILEALAAELKIHGLIDVVFFARVSPVKYFARAQPQRVALFFGWHGRNLHPKGTFLPQTTTREAIQASP
jgi:hypothetical protein